MTREADSAEQHVGAFLAGWVLAAVLLDVGLPVVYSTSGGPTLVGAIYLGFFIGQVGLHAALVVLMPGRLWLRVGSVPMLAVLAMWYLHRHQPPREIELITAILSTQWFLVAVAMVGLMMLRFRLRRLLPVQLQEYAGLPRTQFSLKGLVVLVTVACVLAGLTTQVDWRLIYDPIALLFGLLFALVTIFHVPAVLAPRRQRLPTAIGLGMGCGLGVAVTMQTLDPNWIRTLLFIVPGIMHLAVLLLLRRQGYRLTRVPLPAEVRRQRGTAVQER